MEAPIEIYLKWIGENPTHIITTPRIFCFLGGDRGGTLFGLPLEPDPYCDEGWCYGVNEEAFLRNNTGIEFRPIPD